MPIPSIQSITCQSQVISFKSNPVKQQVMDLFLKDNIKTVLVASHTRPDGDAYGTNIGVSGIFKNIGADVYSTIDDVHPHTFHKFPSPYSNQTAPHFVKTPEALLPLLKKKNLQQFDLGIMTDTAEPKQTTDPVLNLLAQAKKIVIIDHHPDSKGENPNKTKWLDALKTRGVAAENILYWMEPRETASELIGELDRDITHSLIQQGKAGKNLLVKKQPHRLAIAAGIISDAGGIHLTKGRPYEAQLARLSQQTTTNLFGEKESITKNIYKWAIDYSNFSPSKINIKSYLSVPLPNKIHRMLDNIIEGDLKIPSIIVKPATPDDPLMYIHITNNSFFEKAAYLANKRSHNLRITADSIFSALKDRLEEKIVLDKNIGVLMTIKEGNGNSPTRINVRSYGLNRSLGETLTKDHVVMEGATAKIIDALKHHQFGQGGGHQNAMGFRLNRGVQFTTDILPLINSIVKNFPKIKM